MKKVLLIHDLSCFTKSSLSVCFPLLESAGVECALLPTALLSTQSDGFPSLFCKPLSAECHDVMSKWREYGFTFDCLYSGYLACDEQIHIVKECIESFLPAGAPVLIDPVLGDDGILYPNLDEPHIKAMRELVTKASVITPNWTEAQLLINGSAENKPVCIEEAEVVIRKLHELSIGANVVITSVPSVFGTILNIAYDGNEIRYFSYEELKTSYPGSGDMFASLLLAFLLNEKPFFVAVKEAGDITTSAIEYSIKSCKERRLGVALSPAIKALRRYIG